MHHGSVYTQSASLDLGVFTAHLPDYCVCQSEHHRPLLQQLATHLQQPDAVLDVCLFRKVV